eukprot:2197891-Rhodomonas_salina.1
MGERDALLAAPLSLSRSLSLSLSLSLSASAFMLPPHPHLPSPSLSQALSLRPGQPLVASPPSSLARSLASCSLAPSLPCSLRLSLSLIIAHSRTPLSHHPPLPPARASFTHTHTAQRFTLSLAHRS